MNTTELDINYPSIREIVLCPLFPTTKYIKTAIIVDLAYLTCSHYSSQDKMPIFMHKKEPKVRADESQLAIVQNIYYP